MHIELEILPERVEHLDADALLVPVDGAICRLGGAAAGALRAALPEDERADELEYIEDQPAIRAFVDGLAAATSAITVRWSLPDAAHRQLATEALRRL